MSDAPNEKVVVLGLLAAGKNSYMSTEQAVHSACAIADEELGTSFNSTNAPAPHSEIVSDILHNSPEVREQEVTTMGGRTRYRYHLTNQGRTKLADATTEELEPFFAEYGTMPISNLIQKSMDSSEFFADN